LCKVPVAKLAKPADKAEVKKQCEKTPNFSTFDKHWKDNKIKRKAGEYLFKDECEGCDETCNKKCKAIYARSIIDSQMNRGRYSYSLDLLIKIDFHKFVPDLFHMYARNTDHFLEHVIADISTADDWKKDDTNFMDKPRLHHLFTMMTKFKVTNPFYKKEGKIVARDLKGGEKLRVFGRAKELFKEYNRIDKETKTDDAGNEVVVKETKGPLYINDFVIVAEIWEKYDEIHHKIKDQKYPEATRVEQIKQECFDWLHLYEKRYGGPKITVYMHIFGEHLWQCVKLHGDINLFTMQGLEKLNDLMKLAYFSSSNKHSGGPNSCENQMINKKNRIDFLLALEKIPGDIEANYNKYVKFCRDCL
jgi:hypothetical protein